LARYGEATGYCVQGHADACDATADHQDVHAAAGCQMSQIAFAALRGEQAGGVQWGKVHDISH
jgi:hypothetical protein